MPARRMVVVVVRRRPQETKIQTSAGDGEGGGNEITVQTATTTDKRVIPSNVIMILDIMVIAYFTLNKIASYRPRRRNGRVKNLGAGQKKR